MLNDRPYMRQGYGRVPLQASVVLMVVLVVAFALQCINDVYFKSVVEGWLALTPLALARGYVWQLLTFQFLHVDLWHLAGNLLGLWFFGRFVENVLGTKRFLIAYFGSGVIGGLLQCVLMLLFPHHFQPFVFGASAGGMGVFAIFCLLESGSEVRWNFFLPIRADVLLWITGGISLFFTLVPSHRGGCYAHAAHLGGILAGLAWVKLGWHQDFRTLPWEGLWERVRSAFHKPLFRPRVVRRPRQLVRTAATKPSLWRQPKPPVEEELTPGEFISREVDPILDKISQHGIQSLTDRERQILEKARAKMAKR